ncbi:protein ABC transporter 1, mitochondrial [Physcomitrium patens]|uniref:ABC1 atypical kinase-like domain-containing protein n=1 Tax=Physcomitrium patens TaxID=3218 RepID=A0A2K1KG70_PHYPA|nr:protein ABC transporter 1, mitochondrial-like [Physcomitrium patens]PNR52768.1 hypothetical protein PHYPA_009143 [Physcomitrium patens]|eukprot:XP_024378992.1 protein ABC transporter 1, mitochondrial-like [Physcomitrella patens]
MSHLQELSKVASGLAMVVKESIKSAPTLRPGNVGGTAFDILKAVTGTVTDLTGLTQGRVKEVKNRESFHLHEKQDREIAGARDVSSTNVPTSVAAGGRDSYLLNTLDSLGPPRNRVPSASSRTEESLSLVNEQILPSVPETPLSKPLHNFTPVNSNGSHKSPALGGAGIPMQVADRKQESSVDIQATKVEQVLQASHKGSGGEINAGGKDFKASPKKRKVRERRVPSTPIGRVMGFAGLGAGLAWGTFQESARRIWGGQGSTAPGQAMLSPFLTADNAERLALALCRMRGAALKVGQMLSIQDESIVPRPILEALERVRQGADVMPKRQLMKVIEAELGPNWQDRLQSFDPEPIASASIGQVHRAILKDGTVVAMKIQYPGVANSIDSDIENVRRLLDYTNVIPKGLYLDQAMRVAKDELARECDYKLEAANQRRFRELLKNDEAFYVPRVYEEFCNTRVLTTELVPGVPIDKVKELDQNVRDRVGAALLSLTLRELFEFRFMQTDPNWGNFLYDEAKGTINLIDFGAAREYPRRFVDNYLKMILACANQDREQVIRQSILLGFLTGKESSVMIDAHVEAAFVVGWPFVKPGGFDFRTTNLTQEVTKLGATMLRYRLTAPPDEAYSLHRKLSGSFLACVNLGAVVHCREMFLEVYDNYQFSPEDEDATSIRQSSGSKF